MGSWWIPQKGKHMARLIGLRLEVYPPSQFTDAHCVEIYETIRSGPPNRIAHFGFRPLIEANDVAWVSHVFDQAFTAAVSRTIGIAVPLEF